jgi:hypothetical protein
MKTLRDDYDEKFNEVKSASKLQLKNA